VHYRSPCSAQAWSDYGRNKQLGLLEGGAHASQRAFLATALGLGIVLLAPSAAIAQEQTLRPVTDGSAVDTDFNQEGDFVVDGLNSVLVGFNTVFGPGEYRGVYEFDLEAIRAYADLEATLRLNLTGSHLDGTDPDLTLAARPERRGWR
jgi:hypothetical protein